MIVYGNVSYEGTPIMSFVLIPLIWNVCGGSVRCKICYMKVQTIQEINCNFHEEMQNFAKCKYTESRFHKDNEHGNLYLNC